MVSSGPSALPFRSVALNSRDEFQRYVGAVGPMLDLRYSQEEVLASRQDEFRMDGINPVLAQRTSFLISTRGGELLADGRRVPVWRETVVCERTGMINRERALAHFLAARGLLERAPRVRAISEASAFTAWLGQQIGALDLIPTESDHGSGVAGVDLLVSVEAMLGQDLSRIVGGAAQSVAPGGNWVFTTPFHYAEEISRAGADPRVGWDVLSLLKEAGFAGEAHLYWNQEFGYLGPFNFIFQGRRR